MVFFNYATMQMAAKIVYYGPGLCGKTTNLHHIYARTSPQSRGEMVSLETETDRTLFFDLLPIDVGVIGGFKTRLQLYTIPGQVFYNTTRKLVLKGVDGIVFVADSQVAMLEANLESLNNLRENLREIGLNLDDLPLVVQLNKRDLPNVADVEVMLDTLDPDRKYESAEAIASSGTGVFETLKLISKLTLRTLRRRMTGEEPVKQATRRAPDPNSFRVKENAGPRSTIAGGGTTSALGAALPGSLGSHIGASASSATGPETATQTITAADVMDDIETIPASDAIEEESLAQSANVDSQILADAPVAGGNSSDHESSPVDDEASSPEAQESAPGPIENASARPEEPTPAEPPPPEGGLDFQESDKPATPALEVKHVKVRSSVDVMAELEALRKRATQTTTKPARKDLSPLEMLQSPARRREIQKHVTLAIGRDVLGKTKTVRLTVSFEGEEGVIHTGEQTVDVSDSGDASGLTVNLKLQA